jgi:1,4-alpha-glucan branching enzyme
VAKPAAPAKAPAAKTPKAPAKPAAKVVAAKSDALVEVVFERYSPNSGAVDLVGSFNEWKLGKTSLKRNANGMWSTKLKLKPGSYEYKYVYDGMSYEPDPDRQQVPGPFGSANNLLVVA